MVSIESRERTSRVVFTRRSFDRAIRPLYDPLCRYAAIRGGTQDAPDLTQQALSCAWSVIERFDASQPPARLLLWLRRFVDYACDDHLRRLALHPQERLPAEEGYEMADLPDRDSTAELREIYHAELCSLLARVQLTPRQTTCLHAWLGGRTLRQIAGELDLDVGTVWDHIEAAKKRLIRCRKSEEVMIREIFYEEQRRAVCQPVEPTGAALAREHLARLAAQDARHAALCRAKRRIKR